MRIIVQVSDIYSFVLCAYALMSWLPGAYDSRIGQIMTRIVEPILKPLRRLRLQFFGLDWTIFAALILCQIITRCLLQVLGMFLLL